ncbi:ankyrin repeat-containing domain protein [Rhexocercosporidium sp. MPI-PUGE-AT-0058]|nr:ankyrin repeat-containing domain protein [Rhexocercosporidium sp. MPI-PUGE-AT-0058]
MDDKYSQFDEKRELEPPLPLYAAASSGDHTELERLLKISNDMVNQRDKYPSDYPSSTALEVAIRKNDITSVKLLLDHGADPELRLPWSEHNVSSDVTSVCEAAALGFLDVLRLMIDKGGRVTSLVLYSAADSGRLECVKEIFTWLATNKRDEFDDGVTKGTAVAWILQLAAAAWREEIVKFILANFVVDKEDVDYALLQAVVPEADQDEFPKRNCVRKGPLEDARRKRIEVVRLLLEAGGDVEAISRRQDYDYMKPLHEMAREGSRAREIFDMLLDRGAKVNSLNRDGIGHDNGKTPLFQAVLADDVYYVERLLEKGACVTHVDKDGNTLLHASASNFTPACSEIISLLLRHGLSASATNSRGRAALHEASSRGNVEAVRILLASDRDLITCKAPLGWTALHFAANSTAAIDLSALLLKYGADVNEPTAEGWTVLQLAVASNPEDSSHPTAFISYLFENGADITMTDNLRDPGLVWPVHFLSRAPTSRTLREPGVVWQLRDSLLHLAFDKQYYGRSTHLETIRVLLDNGVNMEFGDAEGRTPLLRVIGMWNSTEKFDRVSGGECVVELSNRGADINVKDHGGLGLEDWVKNKGYTITIENGRVAGFERIPSTEPEVRPFRRGQ